MKPRPFYRWKSVWLGVLFFGLLGSPNLGFHIVEEPLEPEDEVLIFARAFYLDRGRTGIFVAHWVLFAVFLPLWGGWLFWRGLAWKQADAPAH